ncbi:FadR/GntR family transcriptional regulator [Roseibium suaedae]|uniref:Transcriptional regulator, GntR family n=1 Tax=Roseibium suaedae TaxID=735517 RepID=A0A1M7KWC4_9HYPH|nr:FCD domain-containing protein [Roseibium suaedae]SHM69562.1 transcriptional regulator, GntR family [Roseibium suaedae]
MSSVPARVARSIQDMISERNLQAGDPLPSQRDMTVLLGASRPSVREAISMLETLGLVRVEKRRGVFVAAPGGRSPADMWPLEAGYSLKEVFQFRASFEPAALRLAFANLTGPALQKLRRFTFALKDAALSGNSVLAAEQDTLFHDVIFENCGNRLHDDIRRHLSRVMQNSQWVPMVMLEQVRDTAEEHLSILAAIEAGDCEAACAALEAHIIAAARRCDIDLDLSPKEFSR